MHEMENQPFSQSLHIKNQEIIKKLLLCVWCLCIIRRTLNSIYAIIYNDIEF